MAKRLHETVECEGRFAELREFLYLSAIPLVVEDRTIVTEEDLKNIWDLAQDSIVTAGYDYKDPYHFCNRGRVIGAVKGSAGTDCLRETPNLDHLSLVPLIENHLFLEEGVISKYLQSMKGSERLAKYLEAMGGHPDRYYRSVLRKEPKDIVFPGGSNLGSYKISGNFGIGTICNGGISGGGVRSDSPFILEVYEDMGRRGEFDLAAIIGFWAQGNEMVVSQMQPGRNGHFPSDVPFGIGCLRTAEAAAERIGFEKVLVYSAKTHPMFRQYPETSDSMKKEFVCLYDGSAKKLGYNGTRCSSYEKLVGNGLNHTR